MNPLVNIVLLAGLFFAGSSFAEDKDANFGSIKKIDLSDERPQSPNHTMITMNLKKVKPGSLAQVILYQFAKRVRLEFEADGLPRGEYILAVSSKCGEYGKAWTDLHRFKSDTAHIQTEKSLPKAAMRDARPGQLVLTGKSLGLFRVKPSQLIDCQPVN